MAGGRVRDVIDEEEDDQGLTVVIDLSSFGDEGKKEKKKEEESEKEREGGKPRSHDVIPTDGPLCENTHTHS